MIVEEQQVFQRLLGMICEHEDSRTYVAQRLSESMAEDDQEDLPASASTGTPSFHIDSRDPLGLLLRKRLKLDWFSVWVVALLIYGPIEKLIIPYFGGYLNLGGGIREWTPHVESLLTGFIEFPLFFAFYLWTAHGIPDQFLRLERSGTFGPPAHYPGFLERVRGRFDSRILTALSIVSAIGAVLLMHSIIWGEGATVGPWFGDRPAARVLSLALIGIVAYAIAQTLFREILAIVSLRQLWKEMGDDLIVHPYHPDGAGGLGAIGRHALFLISFTLVLSLFAIMATIFPAFLSAEAVGEVDVATGLSVRLWNPLIALIWAVYIILVPILFFLLLWPPHVAMSKAREHRLERLSLELDQQLGRAEASFISKEQKLTEVLNEVGSLKEMRELLFEDLPTWPIDRQTRGLFGLTSALPAFFSAIAFVVDLLE